MVPPRRARHEQIRYRTQLCKYFSPRAIACGLMCALYLRARRLLQIVMRQTGRRWDLLDEVPDGWELTDVIERQWKTGPVPRSGPWRVLGDESPKSDSRFEQLSCFTG